MKSSRQLHAGKQRSTRLVLACLGVVLVAACSVTTPRDGFSDLSSGGGQGVARGVGDGGAAGENGVTAALGAPGAAGPSTGPTADGGSPTVGDTSTGGGNDTGTVGSGAPTGEEGGDAAGRVSGPVVGVAKGTITISAIGGFSGNYGAILTSIYEDGFLVWRDELNAAGGVHGRQVVVKKVDNKDTAEGGVAACKQVQTNGTFLAVSLVGFGGADVSGADCLDRAGIPTLAFNLSSFNPKWRNVFSAGDPGEQARPMASFIKNVLGEKKNVGVIVLNDPVNLSARDALVKELPQEGLTLVRQEVVAPNQGSFVAELNRLRSAGATSVALLVLSGEVLGILRDAKALGYQPKWTGSYWPSDETAVAGRSLFEGIRTLRNYSGSNSPGYARYLAAAQKHGRKGSLTTTTMALYGFGLVTGQVLQNAGPSPTRDTVTTGVEGIVNYNNGVFATVTFGKGVRVARLGMWPLQCCSSDGTWRGIGPARERF